MRTALAGIGPRTAHDPGDPLVTSHCPFCGSGSVIGRSDGTISCDFCGQAYIVRVQPAFPGMPQMPSGPGAPSDVGPDGMPGGLVDPGAIGPDGMPPEDGEGLPPGEDDDPGGTADGDPGDEPAPDDPGKPPKPGKAKKKSARYLGVQGQPLTEEQLVRHAAVVASGGDPRVMARLRLASAARRTAAAPWSGILGAGMVHTELPSGHRFSVGQAPDKSWFAMIHAPEHQQAHLIDLGHSDSFPAERANQALADPHARSFIHATSPHPEGDGSMPTTTTRHSDWWNAPQVRRPEDTPFHSASRRPFAQASNTGIVDNSGRVVTAMGWQDHLQPGESITGNEQRERMIAMNEHFRSLGFPVRESRDTEGPVFDLPESGHRVTVGHSRVTQEWHARISHPGDAGRDKTIINLNLGVNPAHTAPLLTHEMGRQPVTGEMMRQWSRAGGQREAPPREPGRRRHEDNPDGSRWYPRSVNVTARGAQLAEEPGEDGR